MFWCTISHRFFHPKCIIQTDIGVVFKEKNRGSHPSGSSQCTSPECPVSCIEPGLNFPSTSLPNPSVQVVTEQRALGSLRHTSNSHGLSILHMVIVNLTHTHTHTIYTFQCYSLKSSHQSFISDMDGKLCVRVLISSESVFRRLLISNDILPKS